MKPSGNSWGGSKGEGRSKGKDDQKESTNDWKDNKGGQGEAPHVLLGPILCYPKTNKMGYGKVAATVGRPMAMVWGKPSGNSWGGRKGESRPHGKDGQKESTKDWNDNKGGQGEALHCQHGIGNIPLEFIDKELVFFFESAQGLLFLRRCSVERVPVQEGFSFAFLSSGIVDPTMSLLIAMQIWQFKLAVVCEPCVNGLAEFKTHKTSHNSS